MHAGGCVFVPAPGPLDVPVQIRLTGQTSGEETEAALGVADAMQRRENVDRRILQGLLLLTGGVEQPVAAEGVRRHVWRHDTVDAVHHEKRRAERIALRL